LTSCKSDNELWKIKKVELGNNENVYLKSWIWGLRGEHSRTIISENDGENYNENKDIDIGQYAPIRYRIENGKFILLESNNNGIQKQVKTEMKNVEIRFLTSDEFLYSDKNIVEDFKDGN
jgi:hypothetical protein